MSDPATARPAAPAGHDHGVHRLASRTALLAARPAGTATLALALFVLYFATAGWGSLSVDVIATYLPSWSLAQHGNADLDGFRASLPLWLHEVDGHWRSDRFPGAILLGVPAYWVFGDPGSVSVGPAAATAAAAAAASVALMHRTLLRVVGPGLALAGALVLGLGTSTWSVAADALWTHTATQLGLCVVLYGLAVRRPWISAIGAVLATAARPHTAVILAVTGLGDLVRTRRLTTAAWLAAGGLAGFAVVLVWTAQTLGGATLLPGTYTGRGNDIATPGGASGADGWPINIAGYLVSPERGLLVLCPFVLVCLAGLALRGTDGVRTLRGAPSWTKDAALAGVAYSVVQLAVNHFAGGWGFYSFRLAIEPLTVATPLLVVGAGAVIARTRWAWALAVLVAYSLAVHIIGSAWYVNLDEGRVWWHTYQPAQLATAVPWHAVVAIAAAVGLTAALAALARSDARAQAPEGPESSRVSSSA